jgi:hypothetical protein
VPPPVSTSGPRFQVGDRHARAGIGARGCDGFGGGRHGRRQNQRDPPVVEGEGNREGEGTRQSWKTYAAIADVQTGGHARPPWEQVHSGKALVFACNW